MIHMFHIYVNGYFHNDFYGYDNAVDEMLGMRKAAPDAKIELYEVTTEKELLHV